MPDATECPVKIDADPLAPAEPAAGADSRADERVARERRERVDYIKLKLMVGGAIPADLHPARVRVPHEVVSHLKERIRLGFGRHSPIAQRTQAFLDRYMAGVPLERPIRLPGLGETFILDRAGMASELSLPEDGNVFTSDIVQSFRLANGQGVLHNPKSDRRTTQGVFHVAEDGLPIPHDKTAVPRSVFARLLWEALHPPQALLRLPFAAERPEPVETFVSLLLRPLVVPPVDGVTPARTSEIEFLAPGNLVGNLDFVERIFGNAGDPHLPENDAGLDITAWTGHTGYVLLAPHLIEVTKKRLGLPHRSEATERQKRDKMCWEANDELYNDGNAFKLTARDASGVMFTIIADNYFGYCKKEVKTQISFAANLLGLVEEEHAGGAIVHPCYDLGKRFRVSTHLPKSDHAFARVKELLGDRVEVHDDGHATDRNYPDIAYVPEDVEIDVNGQSVRWKAGDGTERAVPLDPRRTYVVPAGFKVRLRREADSGQWRLVGTAAEGTFCHKPSTVSGGGKSEISKPISDAILHGPVFIADFEKDMDAVAALLKHDFSRRFRDRPRTEGRPILSPDRSLGSVIKLLTPSETLYTDAYNDWLESIPPHVIKLVYTLKQLHGPDMGDDWRSHFGVDIVNGRSANELKLRHDKLVTHYLRVGFTPDGQWRIFSLRDDFVPAAKLQQEDDISASIVVPAGRLQHTNPKYDGPAGFKIVRNAESRLFQRPDDAIHRGYDRATEAHFRRADNFFSNYEPLPVEEAQGLLDAPITFGEFTPPMREVILRAAGSKGYFVSSAHPRVFEGKPSKNPRYLQERPDLADPESGYLSEIGMRLHRQVPAGEPLQNPVNAVLPGRRLNPPDTGVRSLAVYNPIHYQETPELFMELISSLTGKSPSTTGAGSEGALTKGPFNALLPIIDLNNALVSHLLTGSECFVTAAGYVGPRARVDHDISLLVPEVWSRMDPSERDPAYLIQNGFLERCEDFTHKRKKVLASRLGWRITPHFVRTFFGMIFDNPNELFDAQMLRPETQDLEAFVDGIDNIVGTQKSIAENYFQDGSIERACPPLRALLHIMRDGQFEGKDIDHPEIRALFARDQLLDSAWYRERLKAQQALDIRLWSRHVRSLEAFLNSPTPLDDKVCDDIKGRLHTAKTMLETVGSPAYVDDLCAFLGADPSAAAQGTPA